MSGSGICEDRLVLDPLGVLAWSLSFPELVITGLIITVFIVSVALGVMWLKLGVACWFSW
jgi:hypothetical protein